MPGIVPVVLSRPESLPLEFDADGNAFSARYGDRFASRDGALGQARHVFLAGSGLPQRWARREHFCVLETGFGLGVNFLATWMAWRDDPLRSRRLHYVALERHPIRREDRGAWTRALAAILRADGGHGQEREWENLHRQLVERWPLALVGLHRIALDDGAVTLTLALGDAREFAPQLHMGFDALYLDGFAPDRNPEMWDPRLLRALARLARPGATAASFSCAGAVRAALAQSGFAVERSQGFGSKRSMLQAVYAPKWKTRRREPPMPYEGKRAAIIVGAGLAGASCAHALYARGWNVRVLDRNGRAAGATSALPCGLLAPMLSADDNLASRLSRAGCLFTLSLLQGFAPNGLTADGARLWSASGIFRVDGEEDASMPDALAALGFPHEFARHVPAADTPALLGMQARRAGTWLGQGAIVSAGGLVRALLDQGPAVEKFDVVAVEYRDGTWHLGEKDGKEASAPVLILANGQGLTPLRPQQHAQLELLHGRMTFLRSQALANLRAPISGDGYLLPPLLGGAAAGATFERDAIEEDCADRENLQRAVRLLAPGQVDPASLLPEGGFSGQRCVARDRMPLAGPLIDEEALAVQAPHLRGAHLAELPRSPGLFSLVALGSRGLALAPILGETIACRIEGEPPPLEKALLDAVDPARFILRHLR
jgi:tRNA 5-methylaminomethyl-2-thiouridine biosynthesis bifunctional protein